MNPNLSVDKFSASVCLLSLNSSPAKNKKKSEVGVDKLPTPPYKSKRRGEAADSAKLGRRRRKGKKAAKFERRNKVGKRNTR